MTNTGTIPNQNQEPARKRLQQLQSFTFASHALGATDRRELAKLVSAYNIEHRLNIPPALIGETILFVMTEGAV